MAKCASVHEVHEVSCVTGRPLCPGDAVQLPSGELLGVVTSTSVDENGVYTARVEKSGRYVASTNYGRPFAPDTTHELDEEASAAAAERSNPLVRANGWPGAASLIAKVRAAALAGFRCSECSQREGCGLRVAKVQGGAVIPGETPNRVSNACKQGRADYICSILARGLFDLFDAASPKSAENEGTDQEAPSTTT